MTPSMDLADITEQVAQLRDLFARRLLEDKSKTQLISSLQESVRQHDDLISGDAFASLFKEALLAIDRLRTEAPDAALNESVASELVEAFCRRGLVAVETDGLMNPRVHEVIGMAPASGEHRTGQILHVERDGYLLGSRLLRPARVIVAAETALDQQ